MPFNPSYKWVENEGCRLRYWHQGTGPLLIMIPGAGGHGLQFNAIFEYLDSHFTIVAYDRRQNSASQLLPVPVGDQEHDDGVDKTLNPAQQARDVVAIIKDLGQQKANIFSNSGGGVIALQLAVSYPEHIANMVVHEAPTTILLDDATYHLDRAFMLFDLYRRQGAQAAFQSFRTEMRGYENSPPLSLPHPDNLEKFWRYEFLQFTIYCPDLTRIVRNGVSIGVAAGLKSADAFYARTTFPQAEILQCPRFEFPGHHGGYESEPALFAPALIDAFAQLEERKAGGVA
ncbi:hypothetical protein A1O3_03861 [Capronia epimyces CBS 606.96]|uniref:AB hydrolase-1 domain-containing protein n=1 Tax=Capronia epimyces CBS 606.96 TaxID=1182542 RepID=W9Y292_9EURO|nr:uncharacterized protein A1O3_03861 [Capronia epimyces CBS 606.96]EXJ86907.1 hypothetical protein A1O3_03861 [Capronia epimyces CBS 606.96]